MNHPVLGREQRPGRARLDLQLPVALKVAVAHAAAERGVPLAVIVEEALRAHPDVVPWLREERPEEPPGDPAALTLAQAAERLGVSRQGLHQQIRKGRLHAERDERGRLLIPAAEFERFQRERG